MNACKLKTAPRIAMARPGDSLLGSTNWQEREEEQQNFRIQDVHNEAFTIDGKGG